MPDIICLGELLIDFISINEGVSLIDSNGFHKSPGGAPANVAAGVAKLGHTSGFIGKVGNDPFGVYLKKVLDRLAVNTDCLIMDEYYRTTLSFVALKPGDLRDCMFYRNPGADMMLDEREIDSDYIKSAKVFHFGSISLGAEASKKATLKAIEYAKENDIPISYDPNLRLSLWPDEELARIEIDAGFGLADIVKISDEEYRFITGCETCADCADYILNKGAKLVIVTLGKDGCYYSNGVSKGYVKGYNVKPVETTGAGDAFVAAFLVNFMRRDNRRRMYTSETDIVESLKFANAAGAIATTTIGAIPSLPDWQQVVKFMNEFK